MNKIRSLAEKQKTATEESAIPPPSTELSVLEEIRDILKDKK